MSGGSMDYVYCRISEAADHIASEARRQASLLAKGEYPTVTIGTEKHWFTRRDGSRDFYFVSTGHCPSKELGERTLQHLAEAYIAMRRAEAYARRVEWLTSGDDGEESFCRRLEAELAKVESEPDAWKDAGDEEESQ